jgi:hypothetical protein
LAICLLHAHSNLEHVEALAEFVRGRAGGGTLALLYGVNRRRTLR